MKDVELRRELIDTVRRLNPLGINQGTSGNASVRAGEGFLITPSGVPYEEVEPADVVFMRFDGTYESENNKQRPSSEWRFHLDILKARPDLSALVHTHGVAVTTLACLHMDIPAFHYMIALAGGTNIRCAPYATFGTQELSNHAVSAMEGRKACLLANHGMIAGGDSLKRALALAVEVETLAQMYWRTLQIGQPVILTEAQMDEVMAKFSKGYGTGRGFVGATAGE